MTAVLQSQLVSSSTFKIISIIIRKYICQGASAAFVLAFTLKFSQKSLQPFDNNSLTLSKYIAYIFI